MVISRKASHPSLFFTLLAGAVALSALAGEPPARAAEPSKPGPGSLRGLGPRLPNLSGIVKDRDWAIVLGKALFFDEQVGSDGQSCASCHFSAGADNRIRNQLSPGKSDAKPPDAQTVVFGGLDVDTSPPTQTGLMASGNPAGANIQLVPADFPLHQLADPLDRDSEILFTTNDRVSSQGTFGGAFVAIGAGQSPDDVCNDVPDFVFHSLGKRVRRVEPRNTPTTINAIYNRRHFWDGRGNEVFNGVGVLGRRDVQNNPAARVVLLKANGAAALAALDIKNASAASQAAGPPGSSFEMGCANRAFSLIGRKLFARQPLALQAIDAQDSVFGAGSDVGDIRAPGGHGLLLTYQDLVQLAFESKLWADTKKRRITAQGQLVVDSAAGFAQRELNFSTFFGLSVLLYESTLVSDDTPVDRFFGCDAAQCGTAVPPDPTALDADAQAGMAIFEGKGKCSRCHSGPLFTGAAYVEVPGFPPPDDVIERMIMGDGGPALYDDGFYNTGVTPVNEDLGVGGKDPYGNPLSFTRQYVKKLRTGSGVIDPFQVDPCKFESPFFPLNCSAVPTLASDLAKIRVAVDGAFKTPGLRNVALTAPYFHDGGSATLDQVIDFYDRGGNRRGPFSNDTTGTGPLGDGVLGPGGARASNLDPDIEPLNLTDTEKAQLKAFMLALTDDRVRCRRAPFDGPELSIPNGHAPVDMTPADGRLDANLLVVPETGSGGLPAASCLPNTGNLFDLAPP